MSYPVKVEVFHKILHEAAHLNKPIHENEAYSDFSDEDKELFEQVKLIWEKSAEYQPKEEFNASAAFQSFLSKIETEQKIEENNTISPKVFTLPVFMLRYAAIFVALLVATYFFINRPETFVSGSAGLMVALEDNSKVWLNENSSLTIKKYSSSGREISLEGEAYFDVIKNDEAPFTIQAGDLKVAVVGTSFVLDSKNKVLDVLSGTVKMKTISQEIVVQKNEKVTLVSDNLVKGPGDGQLPGWANPLLVFDNSPLSKVVNDLEAYFGVSIELMGTKDWSQCNFTSGSLVNTRLEDIFTLLKLTYDMEVESQGEKKYIFSKVKCK